VNPNITFDVQEMETYSVQLVALNNMCSDTVVKLVPFKDELIFYIPNTFTPNDNEFNQTFNVVFTSGYDRSTFLMQIFNRWGEQVFETKDTKIGWDGTYNGKNVPDGIYTWKVSFSLSNIDKRNEYVGHVLKIQ
jgi:gliding motility-associated-like protein